MKIYFLVEGEKTEPIVLSAWLKHLLPKLSEVRILNHNMENVYIILSGFGYPGILNQLNASIKDANQYDFDYLVILADADDRNIDIVRSEIHKRMASENIQLNYPELRVVVANKCIETWFLGNKLMCNRNNASPELQELYDHFDISVSNPEFMEKPHNYEWSTADYHLQYLRTIFRDRGVVYRKDRPGDVIKLSYLEELILRTEKGHLTSLKTFLDFCADLSAKALISPSPDQPREIPRRP